MYIKPKPEPKKPKRPKQKTPVPHPEHAEYVRVRKMTEDELEKLSRDHVLALEGLTLLSWDYVIEHGKEFGKALWWDRDYGYYICDFSGDEEVYFTGLAYGVYKDGSLRYYQFYENGEEKGAEVHFYPSGALKSYAVIYDENKITLAYEWDENGMIRFYIDDQQGFRVDEEGYILRKIELKKKK